MDGDEVDTGVGGAADITPEAEAAAFEQGGAALRSAPAATPAAQPDKPETKPAAEGQETKPEANDIKPGTALEQVKNVAEQRTREEREKILNDEAERIRKENAERAQAGAAPLTDEQIVTAWREEMKDERLADPESPDGKGTLSFAEFSQRYPTVADAMARTYLRQQKAMQAQMQPLNDRLAAIERERAADRFFGELEKLGHADARDLANSEKLLTWAQEQDEGVRALLDSSDPKDVDLVLKAFKEATGTPPPAPKSDKAAEARERLTKQFQRKKAEATPVATPRKTSLEEASTPAAPSEQEEAAAFERGAQTAPQRVVRGVPRR